MIIELIEENVKETFSVRKMLHVNNTRLTTYSLIYCFLLQTLQASSDSCDVSRTTVQTVEDCPRSEERWREAAARKNCASYASQCSDPEKLEYHCVINPFLNQTLEVCAYAQNIVLGFCVEYSVSGNMIQESANTYCPGFKKNPCPTFYRSSEAYKYPGCYNLTIKALLVTEDRESSVKSTTVIYQAGDMSTKRNVSGYEGNTLVILSLLLNALTLAVVIFAICGIYYCVRQYRLQTKHQEKVDCLL